MRLLLSAGRTVPTMIPDEIGYLLAGRLLGGGAAGDMSGRTFYQAGYALVVAPVSWFTTDPEAVYRSVIGINAFLGASLFLLMFGLMRRMGLARWPAYALAHAGALLPGLVYWSQFALSDTLLTVVITGWLLLGHVWLRSGRARAGAAAGIAAAYACTIHSRGAVVLTVHFLLVAVVFWKRRAALGRWGSAVAAPVLAGVGGWLLNRWVEGRIYPAGSFSFLPYLTDRLTSLNGYAWTGTLVAGKLWYLSVSGWGIGALGLGVLVVTAVRRGDAADRTMAAAVLVTAGAIALVMSMSLPDEGTVGNYAYGRYLLPLTPVLFAAGAAALVRAPFRVLARAVFGVGIMTVATLGAVMLSVGDKIPKRSYSAYDFPEMAFLSGDWNGLPLWRATWVGLLIFVLAVLARLAFGRRNSAVLCGAVLTVLSIVSAAVVGREVTAGWNDRLGAATSLRSVGLTADDRVAMAYPGMPWQIWTSHAFQVRGGLIPFDPASKGPVPSGVTLIVLPWTQQGDPRRTWPGARKGWHLVLAQPTYLGGWAAWRLDSWRPAPGWAR